MQVCQNTRSASEQTGGSLFWILGCAAAIGVIAAAARSFIVYVACSIMLLPIYGFAAYFLIERQSLGVFILTVCAFNAGIVATIGIALTVRKLIAIRKSRQIAAAERDLLATRNSFTD